MSCLRTWWTLFSRRSPLSPENLTPPGAPFTNWSALPLPDASSPGWQQRGRGCYRWDTLPPPLVLRWREVVAQGGASRQAGAVRDGDAKSSVNSTALIEVEYRSRTSAFTARRATSYQPRAAVASRPRYAQGAGVLSMPEGWAVKQRSRRGRNASPVPPGRRTAVAAIASR